MSTPHPPPLRRSAWTTGQRLLRLLWATLGRVGWLLLPSLRPVLIRLFGGTVGHNCRFAASAEVTIPWNVTIGDNVEVGERVILYSLGMITIGDNVTIDYRAHLCAGSHDMTDPRFPLTRPPITIGAGSFIGLDAYVGPGVVLGRGCRLWPRASVHRDYPDGSLLKGNPARPVGPEDRPGESEAQA